MTSSVANTNKHIIFWLFLCATMIVVMILAGGITRLTHSGLSITEWNPASGVLPPFNQQQWQEEFTKYQVTPEYKQINFNITIDQFKQLFIIEYSHRLLGRILGVLFFIPFIFFCFTKQLTKNKILAMSIIMIIGALQGFIGWYMVSSGLVDKPDVSHYRLSLHLGLALIIYSLILWQIFNFTNISQINELKYSSLINLIILFIQIILGAFVAGLDGGMIYNEFPLMGNSIIPLELASQKSFLNSFEDPVIVQFYHRIFAFIVLLSSFYLYKNCSNVILKKTTLLLILMILLQIVLGVTTLILQVPIVIASMHQLLGIGVYTISFYIFYIAQGK